MQHIKVLDYITENSNVGYSIDLENLTDIADSFNLSLSDALKKGYYFLEKSDFRKAKASSKLCLKLSNDSNEKVSRFINLINAKKIVHYYENENIDIMLIWKLVDLISIFYRVMASDHSLVMDDELEEVFNKVKEIKNNLEVDFKNIMENINIDKISLYEVECLNKILSKYPSNREDEKSINIYNTIIKEVNTKIKDLNKLDKDNILINLKKLSKYMFEESFYISEEFKLFMCENSIFKFENYSDLLKEIRKSHLLYRFNLEKEEKVREEILYNLNITEYFNLNSLYKDYFFEFVDKFNKIYLNDKELKIEISQLIKNVKSLDYSAIPV